MKESHEKKLQGESQWTNYRNWTRVSHLATYQNVLRSQVKGFGSVNETCFTRLEEGKKILSIKIRNLTPTLMSMVMVCESEAVERSREACLVRFGSSGSFRCWLTEALRRIRFAQFLLIVSNRFDRTNHCIQPAR